MDKRNRAPRFHIERRASLPWHKSLAVRLLSILAAFIVCAILTMIITGVKPVAFLSTMVYGSFGTPRKMWITAQNIAVLLCISLAVTPSFLMKFWNEGADGQILMGCLASSACMIKLSDSLPNWLLIIVMLVASVAAGMVWGVIPAFFKAQFNTNETLFTLMLNYIATQIVAYFIVKWEVPKGSGQIGIINQNTELGWFPQLFGSKYILSILTAALMTAFIYSYIRYSKHGYELTVVGESTRTAKYIGIDVKRVIVRTMALSGALAGLIGFLLVSGINHTLTTTITGGQGFTAVMVSWLAQFNPIAMIATSFLIIFLERGAIEISSAFTLNQSFSAILTGIILFFLIGSEFFVSYRIRKSANTETGKEQDK
ncbi:MAG: ABC transporter permease [Oscillospiraceae bacterium]|nr:ABC transporter permease [Oscillospiraceae bacterium]